MRLLAFIGSMLGLSFYQIAAAPGTAAETATSLNSDPMPLVLKDGRIANVSVHQVPFPPGSSDLTEDARFNFFEQVLPLATDCFLTAQAIGHVEKSDQQTDETLESHRLARARAENIQGMMRELGLPASAVAGVWDWKFALQEPRVTLWVFSLISGDDCTNQPFDARAVASVENSMASYRNNVGIGSGSVAAAPSNDRDIASTRLERQSPGSTVTAGIDPAVNTTQPPSSAQAPITQEPARSVTPSTRDQNPAAGVSTQARTGDLEQAAAETQRKLADPPQLVTSTPPSIDQNRVEPAAGRTDDITQQRQGNSQIVPLDQAEISQIEIERSENVIRERATLPSATAKPAPAENQVIARAEPAAQVPASPPARQETSLISPAAITFDVGSSYFDQGGRNLNNLSIFLRSLPGNGPVQLKVIGAVGKTGLKDATEEEALNYNKWLAQKRIDRISEWLSANADNRNIQIVKEFRLNDESRNVYIQPQ